MTGPTTKAASSLRATFLILAAAAAGMGALLAYLPAAGHDQLWLLYVAQHIMAGEKLYGPTLLESNPPLIVWLSLVPAWLGYWLHVAPSAVGKALVVVLQMLIAAASLRTARRLIPGVRAAQVAALFFLFVVLFNVVPARDLGQRDYLLALLCLPYLLTAGLRAGGTEALASVSEGLWVGLLAGAGLALKPHQIVLPIAVEIYLVVRRRTPRTLLRPEPLAIVTVGIAYIVAVYRVTPNYIPDVLPLLRDTYWAVGSLSLLRLILEAIELHILALLAFLLWRRTRRTTGSEPLPEVLLVAGGASLLAYYLQDTGWYYQQLPAICFFALAAGFLLLPNAARAVPAWVPKASAALAVLALALTTHFMNYPFTRDRSFPIEAPDPAFFADLPPGTAVATITTTVDYTVMPAARYGLTIAQRYPHLWMLPAILRNESPDVNHPTRHIITPERLLELDQIQHAYMVEDLTRWKPELVLVQRCQKADVHCQLLEDRDDNLLEWFLRDPAFAVLWHDYSYIGHRGEFDAYVRSEAASAAP